MKASNVCELTQICLRDFIVEDVELVKNNPGEKLHFLKNFINWKQIIFDMVSIRCFLFLYLLRFRSLFFLTPFLLPLRFLIFLNTTRLKISLNPWNNQILINLRFLIFFLCESTVDEKFGVQIDFRIESVTYYGRHDPFKYLSELERHWSFFLFKRLKTLSKLILCIEHYFQLVQMGY